MDGIRPRIEVGTMRPMGLPHARQLDAAPARRSPLRQSRSNMDLSLTTRRLRLTTLRPHPQRKLAMPLDSQANCPMWGGGRLENP